MPLIPFDERVSKHVRRIELAIKNLHAIPRSEALAQRMVLSLMRDEMNSALHFSDAPAIQAIARMLKRKYYKGATLDGLCLLDNLKYRVPDEYQEHVKFIRFLSNYHHTSGIFFHVPNGEKRSKRTGDKLQRMGVKRGVPDIWILWPEQILVIELKSMLGGRTSKEQREWCAKIHGAGGRAVVCNGSLEAQKVVLSHCK